MDEKEGEVWEAAKAVLGSSLDSDGCRMVFESSWLLFHG